MGAGAGPGLVERSPPRQPQGPCLPPRPSRGPSVYKTRNVKSTFPPLWDCWRQALGPCLGPTGAENMLGHHGKRLIPETVI